MEHKTLVAGHNDLKSLATTIADLRYDALAEFLEHLSVKLSQDANADKGRNRPRLSSELEGAADYVSFARNFVNRAWQISKPHMMNEQGKI